MKILNKIWILAAGIGLTTSCTEILDTEPEGSTFTEDQKKAIVEASPDRLDADINGLYSTLGKQFGIFPASERADDFGYPSVCLSADLNGADMWSPDNNYNWFSAAGSLEDRTYTYANPYIRWAIFYNQIKSANDVLASIPADTENKTLLNYKGQALAIRAFDYLNLAQLFQSTYVGNESKPAVPIVTFGMDDPENPRATVEEIYQIVKTDIDEAITLLEGFERPNKAAVNQQIAYGIRARVNLVMQNWAEAASDAAKAREAFGLLTKNQVATPGFTEASEASWMWALIINPVNISDAYASWPSKISSFSGAGYAAAVGCFKCINNLLYDLIPETDVRKGWWVNENLESPLLEGLNWGKLSGQEIASGSIVDVKVPFIPYTNVKFGAYTALGNSDNASDWCIMRAEEMLLIEAEGKAMSGDVGGAKTLLEELVAGNRDDNYTCTASTSEEMQNEVWLQRRIELWGEGFALSDILRLKRNLVRYKNGVPSNIPDAFKFNMAANDGWLQLRIPQREISSNTGISEGDNNNEGSLPQSGDGAGLTDGVVVK